MTVQLALAEAIAREAHANQIEESTGDPYIRHIERVVAMVDGDHAKAVAWLHDVIEDTPWDYLRLVRVGGISVEVADAVLLLSRRRQETYEEYIARILRGRDAAAIAVKIADIRDHLRPNCPARLRPRYERALPALTTTDTR